MKTEVTTLDEKCLFINGGAWKQTEYVDYGIPVVQVKDMQGGTVIWTQPKFLSESSYQQYSQHRLEVNDLVISTVGSHPDQPNSVVGRATIIPKYAEGALLNQNAVCIRPKDSTLDKRYLGYLGQSCELKNFIAAMARGAANQVRIAIGSLKKFQFTLPPLPTQQRIGEILSKYDNLIDNNNRRIALLEESIHLLYKDWFVRLRFPGYESVKVVDGIPDGWKYEPLETICELIMGQSPPSEFYNNSGQGLPFHQGVSNFGNRFITHEIYCTQINRIAEPGDILCSIRAPVGRLNITLDKIIIGRGLSAIRNRLGYQSFQYYQLKKHFFQEYMIGNGSIFASVTRKQLSQQFILVPLPEIIDKFEKISKPIDKQIVNLHFQNQKLKEARDLLLPRLMSGKIKV